MLGYTPVVHFCRSRHSLISFHRPWSVQDKPVVFMRYVGTVFERWASVHSCAEKRENRRRINCLIIFDALFTGTPFSYSDSLLARRAGSPRMASAPAGVELMWSRHLFAMCRRCQVCHVPRLERTSTRPDSVRQLHYDPRIEVGRCGMRGSHRGQYISPRGVGFQYLLRPSRTSHGILAFRRSRIS
ncbi:hypothetical protein BD309DRAFT_71012 [Dichomitus squalens]|uniref:Uncharacterized protein n=1 Tax=Dichomitus squalens TaxID=114155 RepID=A0A4Q9NRM6_9APHY|nr:hypothetical protein BD309DRAFT_71012 [Dichomitus squalens]TBU60457.1 hypothetical protein BD310DRAFT_333511 [Dichomitus squalens]